ncbi:MAG: hypothetical protein WC943_14395 [Elusimicrobiota bacterium]
MNALRHAFAVLLGCGGLALAQGQYRGLPFPPDEIFEAMLSYADDGGFKGLSAALGYVRPLTDRLKREFKEDVEEDLRAAIAQRDRRKCRMAVASLIFLDMRLNLKAATEAEDESLRAALVQMAFIDYGFLSPEIKAADRALDKAARDAFRRMHRARDSALIKELAAGLLGRLWTALSATEPPQE